MSRLSETMAEMLITDKSEVVKCSVCTMLMLHESAKIAGKLEEGDAYHLVTGVAGEDYTITVRKGDHS